MRIKLILRYELDDRPLDEQITAKAAHFRERFGRRYGKVNLVLVRPGTLDGSQAPDGILIQEEQWVEPHWLWVGVGEDKGKGVAR